MLKKLRFRFILVNMTIVTLLLALMFTTLLHFTRENMETESSRLLHSIAGLPFSPAPFRERDLPNEMGTSPDPDIPEAMDSPIHLPYFILYQNTDGTLFTEGSMQSAEQNDRYPETLMAMVTQSGQSSGILPDYDLQYLLIDGPQGTRVIFADIASQQSALHSLYRSCIQIGSCSFLFFLVLSLFLARIMVKPVETAWHQQRRFVADASHELKTPLTVILTNAQLLQNGCDDEDSKTRFLGSILTMADHMKSLVEQLLELARADSGDWREQMVAFDFSSMIFDALLPFEPLLFEAGLQFDARVQPGIRLLGSEGRLREVLEILLDNARKYASANGSVQVSVERLSRNRCRLRVSNTGEPISAEQQKELFKRFYRADSARSRDGGFGLGLSIAQEIVVLHRGKISVDCIGGWNIFNVELPTV